jgi:hypothetical protein
MGIKNCKHAVNVPIASGNQASPLTVKENTLVKVAPMLEKRFKTEFPLASEKQINEFKEQIKEYIEKDFWQETKTKVIAINGYDSRDKHSIFVLLTFTNENIPANGIYKFQWRPIYVEDKSYDLGKTFMYYTKYDLQDNKIVNVEEPEGYDFKEVMACVPAVAPFFFGTAFLANTDFVMPAVEYINANSMAIAKKLRFEHTEVMDAISKFRKYKAYDFEELRAKILKVCLTTPTPIPTPEVEPEEPEEPVEENFGQEKRPRYFKNLHKKRIAAHKKHHAV